MTPTLRPGARRKELMAFDLRSRVQIYDEWFVRLGFSEKAFADWLAGLRVTYVLAQSRQEDVHAFTRSKNALAAAQSLR